MTNPEDPDSLFEAAASAHESGDLASAERLYRAVLDHDRDDAVTLELLGSLLISAERLDEASLLLDRSVAIDPTSPTAFLHRSEARRRLGSVEGAVEDLRRCLQLDPSLQPAMVRLAHLLGQLRRIDELADVLGRLRAAEPDSPDLPPIEARLRLERGDAAGAVEVVSRLGPEAEADPAIAATLLEAKVALGLHDEAVGLLGRLSWVIGAVAAGRGAAALLRYGRPAVAASWFLRCRDALQIDGDASRSMDVFMGQIEAGDAEQLRGSIATIEFGDAAVDARLGYDSLAAGATSDAIAPLARAARLRPDLPQLSADHAWALQEVGRPGDALAVLESARSRHPSCPKVLANLGRTLASLHRDDEAEKCFREAIDLDPRFPAPMMGLAILLQRHGRLEECVALCRSLERGPSAITAAVVASEACSLSMRQREGFESIQQASAASTEPAAHSQALYLSNFPDHLSERDVFDLHAAFGRRFGDPASARDAMQRRRALREVLDRTGRVRIGFLSPDFRRHSVWYFIEPLLCGLDRGSFEVVGISDTNAPDSVTERIRAIVDVWHPVPQLRDDDLALAIEQMGLDILVELAGHTDRSRLGALGRRLAPVQASYLGYPNTTGLPSIDFRLVDALTDPPGSDHLATETLLRLRRCFVCHLKDPRFPSPISRSGGRAITFGCFNSLAKVTPTTISAWSRTLSEVHGSRLLLKSKSLRDEATRRRLIEAFAARGTDPSRLELRGWESRTETHLAVYGEVDVALDTFPYHGTTTTCEALSMGVPVVTMSGGSHRSRVGASILHAIGRGDLVARDEAEFVRIAATTAAEAGGVRRDLLEGTVLRDPKRLAADLVEALEQAADQGDDQQR